MSDAITLRWYMDAFSRLTRHGWLSWEEGALLVLAAAGTTGDIVEFGTCRGRSAMLLAQLGRPLHCVDLWQGYEPHSTLSGKETFQAFLTSIANLPDGGRNIIPHRMAVENWRARPAGLVYCDGDHSHQGTVAQLRKALECGPAVVAVHDYKEGSEVQAACTAVLVANPDEVAGKMAVWRVC